jgi:hypothetical protein
MTIWHLKSGSIDELVNAKDQFDAWLTLRDRPAGDFGLVVSAEPDERPSDAVHVRTSALMFAWGREDDAEQFIDLAIDAGLPDTTDRDRAFAQEHAE